jgi:alkanesulfonate monooxygenase SsuD/methylene tetrahydromethanopterin reductase-like flavin-dependent oxidoreductase (luciferase family)
MTPNEYRSRLAVLEAACERVGRDPETLKRSLGLTTLVGEDEADLERRYARFRAVAPPGTAPDVPLDEWREGRLVGTVGHVRQQLEDWAGLGVTTVIANLGAVPFAVTDVDDLDMVAAALPKE